MMDIENIRRDLAFLADHEALLFGSAARGDYGPRSDIDVAIITRTQDPDTNHEVRLRALSQAPEGYDIHVFELLPIIVVGEILKDYVVLFGNPPDIGMYLYHYRKLWGDYRHRLEVPTLEEIKHGVRLRYDGKAQ